METIKNFYYQIERGFAAVFGYKPVKVTYTVYPIQAGAVRNFTHYMPIKTILKLQHLIGKAPITTAQFEKLTGLYTGGNYVKITSVVSG